MIEQMIIAVTGVIAIFLTQSSNPNIQKYACLVGVVGQPFWMMATYQSGQWGMFVLTLFYTLAWCRGIYNFWFRQVRGC
ncbi:hypothetical protein [Methylophaga sp. OBS4]|uniref:hypothetical protein n=1 Tax=Methylophaga sp. OBS4 TaxID=2991935 RepID=UPI00224E981A|nr:hypothetical protein [Methylophaga sp. OBS4]MCX4187182.1 hypothetical protein [Methylophaga sp. OBS4]